MTLVEWRELKEFCGDYNLSLENLFTLFFKQVDEKIPEIESFFLEKDYKSLSSTAHFLKGSSNTLMVFQLGDLFEELEQSAKHGVLSSDAIITQAKNLISHLRKEVDQELGP